MLIDLVKLVRQQKLPHHEHERGSSLVVDLGGVVNTGLQSLTILEKLNVVVDFNRGEPAIFRVLISLSGGRIFERLSNLIQAVTIPIVRVVFLIKDLLVHQRSLVVDTAVVD